LILSCPAKTFLLGEYVALDGGPSLLLSTAPRFQLTVRSSVLSPPPESGVSFATGVGGPGTSLQPWHPESPAGRLAARHAVEVAKWSFEFQDPFAGRGGLGASSAQFALLYAFLNDWTAPLDLKTLLAEYRECAWSGEGTPPSGADVVAQLTGGVTYFDGRSFSSERLAWPFPEIGFSLIRTGAKLATHEHLREGALAPHATLRTIVLEARKAFETHDEMRLIEAVNACALVLRQSGLTAPTTTDLLDQMRDNHELFWAAKGCGAMGADIVVVLHPRSRADDVVRWAKGRGLEVCGTQDALTSGLEVLQLGGGAGA
jgi:mevalonate kinase